MSADVRGSLGFIACGGGNLVRGCPRTTKRCVSARKQLSAMSAVPKCLVLALSAAARELSWICRCFGSAVLVSGYVFGFGCWRDFIPVQISILGPKMAVEITGARVERGQHKLEANVLSPYADAGFQALGAQNSWDAARCGGVQASGEA